MMANVQHVPTVRSTIGEVWHFFSGGAARQMVRMHKDFRRALAQLNEHRGEIDTLERAGYQHRTRVNATLDELLNRTRKLELAEQARAAREHDAIARAIAEGGRRMDAALAETQLVTPPRRLPPLPALLPRDPDWDEDTAMVVTERDLVR